MDNLCPQCGAPTKPGAATCEYCGAALAVQPQPSQPYQPPIQSAGASYTSPSNPAINPAWPIKNKLVAGILAIILGGFGIHEFYLGRIGRGIVMLVFCWTYIPALIGFVQGIIMLCSNDENFQLKYKVRLQ